MGKILPSYKKAVIDEIVDNIYSNTSQYYAFAANPVAYPGTVPEITNDDYTTHFTNDWLMLFGKKIKANDIVPVISNKPWSTGSTYDRYDNTSNTLFANDNFYVISPQAITGANFHVYKCIDNANGSVSTVDPGSVGIPTQPTTFQTDDGYKWRYMYSISEYNYDRFKSDNYIPVYSNTTVTSLASSYSGVDVVMITNAGIGYTTYTNGTVKSVQNSSVIQIENFASSSDNFYVKNAIYLYNTIEATSQIRTISSYVSNSSGKFVYLTTPVDITKVNSGLTQYLISPAVVFETDGDSKPKAYAVVNTTNYSISNVIMLDSGSNISWANVKIESNYGSGANVYAIVPPPGGHGADPITELNVMGYTINFGFSNSEFDSIPDYITYNKIGLIKNPNELVSNTTTGTLSKGAKYTADTFNQLLTVNTSVSTILAAGTTVFGANSKARAIVVSSNSTQIQLAGDKYFIDGEGLANSSGAVLCNITIKSVGNIYTKDAKPLYIDNINNVTRSNTQTEVFKLTVEI